MRFFRRSASALLWLVTIFALAVGALGIASLTGLARLSTVSDNSAAPVAFEGSLAVALREESSEVRVGDLLLIGAHSAGGSTLGEVISLDEEKDGARSVVLKAPNRVTHDQWSYELGAHTYKQQFSVPLVGYVFAFIQTHDKSTFVTGFAGVALITLLVFFRVAFFKKRTKRSKFWSPVEVPNDHALEELAEIFTEAGVDAPEVSDYEEGLVTWKKSEATA